jgi:hypothetical protein
MSTIPGRQMNDPPPGRHRAMLYKPLEIRFGSGSQRQFVAGT